MTEIIIPSIKLTMNDDGTYSHEFLEEFNRTYVVDVEKVHTKIPVRGKNGKRVGNMDRYRATIEMDFLFRVD